MTLQAPTSNEAGIEGSRLPSAASVPLKRRCLLHIGLEKTGSTSLQALLAANRDDLARRGILYPRSAGRSNHLHLVTACLDFGAKDNIKADHLAVTGMDEAEWRQRFLSEFDSELRTGRYGRSLPGITIRGAADWHTLVLSSELISSRLVTKSELDRLLDWIAGYVQEIEIVAVLRRQDRLAISRFSSSLRAGNPDMETVFTNESRRLFAQAPAQRPRDDLQDFYDYERLLGRFERAARRCQIKVRLRPLIYDPPGGRGEVIAEFLKLLGVERQELAVANSSESLNPALGNLAQRVIARLNQRLPYQLKDGRINPLRRALVRRLELRVKGPARAIARNEARTFYRRFEASNEAVRRAYFPDASSLFDPDFDRYPEVVGGNNEALDDRKAGLLALGFLLLLPGAWLRLQAGAAVQRWRRRAARLAMRSINFCRRLLRYFMLRSGRVKSLARLNLSPGAPQPSGQGEPKPVSFTIARIIGNDLPPRQAKGQMLANLRHILEEEANFPHCSKVFVLNRLFDPHEEAQARAMIEGAGHVALVRSFDAPHYATLGLDMAIAGEAPDLVSAAFATLPAKEQANRFFRICRAKIAYALDINGARNQALRFGQERSEWTFVLDGACFLSQAAARRLFDDAGRAGRCPYLIIPMRRLVEIGEAAAADWRVSRWRARWGAWWGAWWRAWQEEPQIAFHRSASSCFDERFIYGLQDKTSLLKAIGVPGPWQHWRDKPGAPKLDAWPRDRFCFKRAGAAVFRLPSRANSAPLEQAKAGDQRHEMRSLAVLGALDDLDQRCLVAADKQISHILVLPDLQGSANASNRKEGAVCHDD